MDTVTQVDYDILVNKLIDANESIENLSKQYYDLRNENAELKKDLARARYSNESIWKLDWTASNKLMQVFCKDRVTVAVPEVRLPYLL